MFTDPRQRAAHLNRFDDTRSNIPSIAVTSFAASVLLSDIGRPCFWHGQPEADEKHSCCPTCKISPRGCSIAERAALAYCSPTPIGTIQPTTTHKLARMVHSMRCMRIPSFDKWSYLLKRYQQLVLGIIAYRSAPCLSAAACAGGAHGCGSLGGCEPRAGGGDTNGAVRHGSGARASCRQGEDERSVARSGLQRLEPGARRLSCPRQGIHQLRVRESCILYPKSYTQSLNAEPPPS